jgi:hypothetical protein
MPVGLKPGSANSKGHWQMKVSFAVGITDNGEPGTNDFFSIQFSNGYSASRYPLNGDISIHYNTSGSVEESKLLFC